MEIFVLTDNNPGAHTEAEHGLSYLIAFDDKKILFDTGQSDLFMRNSRIMGLDLSDVDTIVLSHGHYDHGNGLEYLQGGKLVCHPGCFIKRYRKKDLTYNGLKNTKQEISQKFDLITTTTPYRITDKVIFLGEIPRLTDFESKSTNFLCEGGVPDFITDDSALALLHDKGLFVVTGCGHAGIVNTLEYAGKVTGEKRIFGIAGGFHLKENDRQTKETIRYLKEHDVKHVLPSHCTALPAFRAFRKVFGSEPIKTGDILAF